jgi:hypothetical protein
MFKFGNCFTFRLEAPQSLLRKARLQCFHCNYSADRKVFAFINVTHATSADE